jgi:hypothetical protein
LLPFSFTLDEFISSVILYFFPLLASSKIEVFFLNILILPALITLEELGIILLRGSSSPISSLLTAVGLF